MAPTESRPFDALYDTSYAVSGARDHYKQQGRSAGFLVEKVPEYGNMFSELSHFPAATLRLKNEDKIPAFVDREFHPSAPDQMQRAYVSSSAAVEGPNNPKYYTRPLLAPGATTLTVRLAPPKPATPPPPYIPEPPTKDMATQSDYRESETQTTPWTPDYVVPMGAAVTAKQAALSDKYHCLGPEVLQIADLKLGSGLPGGAAEVALVEKRRAKRAFEAGLPPLDDLQQLPARLRAVEAAEAAEWAEREAALEGEGEERLTRLALALAEREATIEGEHRERVEARSTATLTAKMPVFGAIAANRVKALRSLASARRKVDSLNKATRKTLVQQYADYGSQVYAPILREGRTGTTSPGPGAGSSSSTMQLDPEAFVPNSLPGVLNLQASLPSKMLTAKIATPAPPLTMSLTSGSTQGLATVATATAGKKTMVTGTTQTHGGMSALLASTKKALAATSSPAKRQEAAIQADVEAIGLLLETAKTTAPRGVGEVWPYPLGMQCPPGSWGGGVTSGTLGRASKGGVGAGAGGQTGGRNKSNPGAAAAAAANPERPSTPSAPPLPSTRALDAAAVLLQRLLRGRAAQNRLYAAKSMQLELVRELQAEPAAAAASGGEGEEASGAAGVAAAVMGGAGGEAATTTLAQGAAALDASDAAEAAAAADVEVGTLLCQLCCDLQHLAPGQLQQLLAAAGIGGAAATARGGGGGRDSILEAESSAAVEATGGIGVAVAAETVQPFDPASHPAAAAAAGSSGDEVAASENVTPAAAVGVAAAAAAASAQRESAVEQSDKQQAAASTATAPDATEPGSSATAAAAAGAGAGGDGLTEAWGSAGQLSGGNSSDSIAAAGAGGAASSSEAARAAEGAAAGVEGAAAGAGPGASVGGSEVAAGEELGGAGAATSVEVPAAASEEPAGQPSPHPAAASTADKAAAEPLAATSPAAAAAEGEAVAGGVSAEDASAAGAGDVPSVDAAAAGAEFTGEAAAPAAEAASSSAEEEAGVGAVTPEQPAGKPAAVVDASQGQGEQQQTAASGLEGAGAGQEGEQQESEQGAQQ